MPKKPSSRQYSYTFEGTVVNFHAPIVLPSDNKPYFEFGFQSPGEDRIINAVFYISFDEPKVVDWVSKLFRALIQKKAITVSWSQHVEWDPRNVDPSGYIFNVV